MYPTDRRNIARHIYSMLHSLRKTALLCQVSHSTISRWINNPIKKKYTKPNKTYKTDQIIDTIKFSIINDPFISIIKLKDLILSTLKINVSKELIRIAIKRQGITKKIARFYGNPVTLPEKTEYFLNKRNEYIDDHRIFISIDETSFGRNGVITKGYSKKGEKLFIKKLKPRMTTTSVVAAFSKNELIGKMDIKGSINTDLFLEFIDSLDLYPGMVLLMDNVRFHHSNRVKELCKDKNIDILYTPPYSPWFNPIELCFSIVKRSFYKFQDIDKAFDSVNEEHLNAFFTKSLSCKNSF
jgi:transposase